MTASPRVPQGLGHLEPDVASADDYRALRTIAEYGVEREAVADRVQLADAVAVDAWNRWPDGPGACGDDQLVVAKIVLDPVAGARCDRA